MNSNQVVIDLETYNRMRERITFLEKQVAEKTIIKYEVFDGAVILAFLVGLTAGTLGFYKIF